MQICKRGASQEDTNLHVRLCTNGDLIAVVCWLELWLRGAVVRRRAWIGSDAQRSAGRQRCRRLVLPLPAPPPLQSNHHNHNNNNLGSSQSACHDRSTKRLDGSFWQMGGRQGGLPPPCTSSSKAQIPLSLPHHHATVHLRRPSWPHCLPRPTLPTCLSTTNTARRSPRKFPLLIL